MREAGRKNGREEEGKEGRAEGGEGSHGGERHVGTSAQLPLGTGMVDSAVAQLDHRSY